MEQSLMVPHYKLPLLHMKNCSTHLPNLNWIWFDNGYSFVIFVILSTPAPFSANSRFLKPKHTKFRIFNHKLIFLDKYCHLGWAENYRSCQSWWWTEYLIWSKGHCMVLVRSLGSCRKAVPKHHKKSDHKKQVSDYRQLIPNDR